MWIVVWGVIERARFGNYDQRICASTVLVLKTKWPFSQRQEAGCLFLVKRI